MLDYIYIERYAVVDLDRVTHMTESRYWDRDFTDLGTLKP